MPVVAETDKARISLSWDIIGESTNQDKIYSEGWAVTGVNAGYRFFDKSFIIAVFSHQAKVNRNQKKFEGRKVRELPFFLARPFAMDLYHTLKYRTLIFCSDDKGQPYLRPMKHVEIDVELMRQAALYGFDRCYRTDPKHFTKAEDPIRYVAKFIS